MCFACRCTDPTVTSGYAVIAGISCSDEDDDQHRVHTLKVPQVMAAAPPQEDGMQGRFSIQCWVPKHCTCRGSPVAMRQMAWPPRTHAADVRHSHLGGASVCHQVCNTAIGAPCTLSLIFPHVTMLV